MSNLNIILYFLRSYLPIGGVIYKTDVCGNNYNNYET